MPNACDVLVRLLADAEVEQIFGVPPKVTMAQAFHYGIAKIKESAGS